MAEGVHLALLPWLAFGHLIPFLQLAVALAKSGFRISFISTPKNIQRLPKVPPHLAAQIKFVEFPLPHVDGLPEATEATVDLPTPNDDYLKKAYDLLRHPFERFVAEESPDWIIHDLINHWTAEIAKRFSIPRVLFSICSAGPLAFLGVMESKSVDELRRHWSTPQTLMSTPSWIRFPSTVAFLPHEANILYDALFSTDASGITIGQRILSAIEGCEAIAIRSCAEYEGEYLEVLKTNPKPVMVIPIGLLPTEKREMAVDGEWATIFRWLDEKAHRSVVFVGFGSECKLSRNEVYEIALGLEISNLDFLWALRRPAWAAEDDSDVLPPGFVTRTMGRGVVSLGWAPQIEILAHPAIGGSLFHAGWGSVIETVQFGHVLVLLPCANVQGLDARLAVEKGVGLEVERDEDGTFHRDAIARTLRRAMVEEEGERVRIRSREMMAIFGDQRLHDGYLSGFVDFLKGYKRK